MLWGAGIGELFLAGEAGLPAHSVLVALLSVLFMALFLIAQFGLHLKALLVLENGNSEHARYLIYRLRPVLFAAFIIAVVVAMLHVSGAALVPADLLEDLL
jgi:heme/copper-type cytochrome/quinol oxidase subunit 4